MNTLSNRLETFAEWPSEVPVKPKSLAEAGFYYVGDYDKVCCFACGGTFSDWKVGDRPEDVHRERFRGKCPFIRSDEEGSSSLNSGLNRQSENTEVINQPVLIQQYDPIGDEDMECEQKRLRSFKRNSGWPGAVSAHKLAMAGFYFTGVDDNVKCFACDLSLKRWEPEDDPITEHIKHQPTCPFLVGSSERVPSIDGGVWRTSATYNCHQENYMGRVPIAGNDIHSHRPTLEMPMRNQQPANTMNALYQNIPYYTGHQPVNYANEHTRLHTFINWPKECPVQPKELIDAGFYYIGEEDRACCFKCGITLAGWEPEDTPWGEHEKWSRECSLVQERLHRRDPHATNLATSGASILPKEQTWISQQETVCKMPNTSKLPGATAKECRTPTEQSESPPVNRKHVDYPSSNNDVQGKTVNNKREVFYLQKAVQELIDRGYNYEKIQETILYKTKVCGENIDSLEELLDALVLFMEGDVKNNRQTDVTSSDEAPKSPVSEQGFSLSVDPEALHLQVEKMQEAHTCKICLDAEIGVLFLPCGHLVCCPACAHEIQTKSPPLCPICRKHIDSNIRTYLP